jgi:hypothetical protein
VPWLRGLVADLSPRSPGFDPGLVCMRFVVDEVAVGQVFLPARLFSLVRIILPMLHTNLNLHVFLTRMTNRRSVGILEKEMFFRKLESVGQTFTSFFFVFVFVFVFERLKLM